VVLFNFMFTWLTILNFGERTGATLSQLHPETPLGFGWLQ